MEATCNDLHQWPYGNGGEVERMPNTCSIWKRRLQQPLAGSLGWNLTIAENWRNPNTEKILEDEEESQEEAVLGPELGNGLTPPPCQDDNQPASMEDHHEVHALANHVHCH